MRRCVPSVLALVALSLLVLVAPACGGTENETAGDEICDNGVDDDADGLTDCADSDCTQTDDCATSRLEHCYNLVDDDRNGDVDCDDDACANTVTCIDTYENCVSPGDEDGDGTSDCEDPDCMNTATCTIGAEDCQNGTDDDGDGDVDCDDSDCANTSDCQAQPENCENGADDDDDGDVDCDDTDCANTAVCLDGGEACLGGADEDGDGRIDCADTDCAYTRTCLGTLEVCTNGVDDDGNGVADCADPACADAVVCLDPQEDCSNRIDDDGDGDIDCDDADCSVEPMCRDEICDDGTDNDGDGLVDCQDYDCARDTDACTCDDLADDDGDEIPNCTDDDVDGDNVANGEDNCPDVPNADQTDSDGDNIGDACEADTDYDGVIDDEDNCPYVFNPEQDPGDTTVDGGLVCEDPDNDGHPTPRDNCPNTANPTQQRLANFSGPGDACATQLSFNADLKVGEADNIGEAMANAGDFNGDGHDDLLLGSAESFSGAASGEVYLLFSPIERRRYSTPIADMTVTGSGSLGRAVAGIGDVDGDGDDEFAVSEPGFNNTQVGSVYIFLGSATPLTAPSTLDADVEITPSGDTQFLGRQLAGVGDVTDDGIEDLLVLGFPPTTSGTCGLRAFVFSGADVAAATVSGIMRTADAVATFEDTYTCPGGSNFWGAISGGGDFNQDGIADFAIGDNRVTAGGFRRGRVMVFYGSSTLAGNLTDTDANWTVTGTADSDDVGAGVTLEGDFDGDGADDLGVGSPGSTAAYIWYGSSSIGDGSTVTTAADTTVTSPTGAGGLMSIGGDLDGDGLMDLVTAGAARSDGMRVIFGRDTRPATIDGDAEIQFLPISQYNPIGSSVLIGDFSADGRLDVATGNGGDAYMLPNPWDY